MLNLLNKAENTKVNYAIRQVLHKAALYCYLNDLVKLIENDLVPEINKLKGMDKLGQETSFKERNTRVAHLNEIVDSVRIFFIISKVHILCIDLNIVKKFITDFRLSIIV